MSKESQVLDPILKKAQFGNCASTILQLLYTEQLGINANDNFHLVFITFLKYGEIIPIPKVIHKVVSRLCQHSFETVPVSRLGPTPTYTKKMTIS